MNAPSFAGPAPDSDRPVLQTRGLTKVFRDFWRRPRVRAVDALDLEVRRGEVFGLLGPNGSGKSTTIKTVLGLLHPTAGEVAVFDRPPDDIRTKARVGYLPEESYLYKYLTAAETLDFYGRLFGLSKRERRTRADELIEMVGLKQAAARRVGEFSKGMARRIGLAQALINNPELVILDEPTSGLDPIGTRQVKDLILALAAAGKTVLLSSHLLADVEDVCDRVAVLYNGRLRAMGNVKDLLRERDRCTLTVPALEPRQLAAVLAELRRLVSAEPRVDYPERTLEQFFLQVVEDARKLGAPEQGAGGSGAIAPFLAGPRRGPRPPDADSGTPAKE